MNGALHINDSNPRYSSNFTLGLIFEGGAKLRCFTSAVSVELSLAAVLARHAEGVARDVCADAITWDPDACAAHMLALPPATLVADAVLDQAVLPGAGNIIKVESLHRACISPSRPLSSLSDADIRSVVAEVRSEVEGLRRIDGRPMKRASSRRVHSTLRHAPLAELYSSLILRRDFPQ